MEFGQILGNVDTESKRSLWNIKATVRNLDMELKIYHLHYIQLSGGRSEAKDSSAV